MRRLVTPLVRRQFDRVGRGEHAAVVAGLADDVHHVFAGEHALGGERHDKTAVALWFARLGRLCPELRFEVHEAFSSGPPWDLRIVAEWTAQVRPAAGDPYVNHGAHVIRIRRGKVVALHAYEDSQVVARACEQMRAAGIEEAGAPPITS